MKISLQEALDYIQLPEEKRTSAGKNYNLRVLDAVNRALRCHQDNADFVNYKVKIFAKSFNNPSEPKSKILRIIANFFSRLQNKLHGLSFLTSKEMSDNILSHYKQPVTELSEYIDRLPDFLQDPENVNHVTEVEEIEDPQEKDTFSFTVVFNEEDDSYLLHVRYRDNKGRVHKFVGEQASDLNVAIFHKEEQIGEGSLLGSIADIVKSHLAESFNEEELTLQSLVVFIKTSTGKSLTRQFPKNITVLEAKKRVCRVLAEEGEVRSINQVWIRLGDKLVPNSRLITGNETINIHIF